MSPKTKTASGIVRVRLSGNKELKRVREGKVKIKKSFKYEKVLQAYENSGLQPSVRQGEHMEGVSFRRPLFARDPSIRKMILRLISKGYHYTTVCRYVGVKRETFMKWLTLGRSGANKTFVDFYNAVCKAESVAEMTVLASLKKHQAAEWRASAWELERRWPEHWSRQDAVQASLRVEGEVQVTHKHTLGKRVVDDGAARDLARKLIDGSEFGFSEVPQLTDQSDSEDQ